MKRRLFINQVSAGLALSLLPIPGFSQEKGVLDAAIIRQAATSIQKGLIGTIEQVTVIHRYTTQHLSANTLERIAQRDINAVETLTNLHLLTGGLLTQDSPSTAFGSYATRLLAEPFSVTWQGLAWHGSSNQVLPSSCSIRVFGSKGIFQTINNGSGYQIQNLTGRIVEQVMDRAV